MSFFILRFLRKWVKNIKSEILHVHIDGAVNNFSKQKRKCKYTFQNEKETVI